MGAIWDIDDYGNAGVIFSGSRKLADSSVAPLVAQARGYTTLGDRDAISYWANNDLRKLALPGDERTVLNVCNGEAMVIPWFSSANVFDIDERPTPAAIQMRAAIPREVDGKKRKYEMLPGHRNVLDVHPATERSWGRNVPSLLITEGVIKADSALTAQLLAAGVGAKELLAIPGRDTKAAVDEARDQLAALMERVPPHDRVLIVGAIGVSSWRRHPDWDALPVKDHRVFIAFDGDIRTNPQVHQMTDDLVGFIDAKRGVVRIVDLGGPEAEAMKAAAGYPAEEKLGLDDFLSKVGSWPEALALTTSTIPGLKIERNTPLSIHELFRSRGGTHVQEFELTFDGDPEWIVAKIGPAGVNEMGQPTGETGLYRRSWMVRKDEKGNDVEENGKKVFDLDDERLLTFVTIVVSRAERRMVSPLGLSEIEPGGATVDLWTLTRTGHWIPTLNVPQADAEDPKKLMLLTDVSEMAPVGRNRAVAEGALAFCVRKLGRDERATVFATPTTCLVKRDGGSWSMVLAGGSLNAHGPSDEVVLNPLMGELERTGFPHVARSDDEIRDGLNAINAMFAMNEKRVTYTQFAHFLQAWYPSNMGHGLLALIAKPGFGKSAMMSVTQGLALGATPKNKFTFAFTKATARGIVGASISARNAVVFGDDYRTSGTRSGSSLERVEQKPGVLAQATYSDSERVAGTADGGFVHDGYVETTGFMTGEQRPFGDAIQGRTLIVEMAEPTNFQDVIEFGRQHAEAAQKLMGRYVCDVLAELDDLKEVKRAHERRNDRWSEIRVEMGLEQERATELAAHMQFGYERFLQSLPEWAHAELPSATEMFTVLRDVRDENIEGQAEGAVASRVLEMITEWLAAGSGHITYEGVGGQPTHVAGLAPSRLGWAAEERGQYGPVYVAKGSRIGEISKDGTWIAVTNEALKRAAEKVGHHIADTKELVSLLGSLAPIESKPGDKAPSKLGFKDRPRSVVVSAELLGLLPDEELLAAATRPANVTSLPVQPATGGRGDERELVTVGAATEDMF